ncbi:MAG: M48 family metallopeptidase [Proteobacteria bacterium]|nr:M48 family metallopeptidase [Pseudomonadota bacterium]
MCTVEARQIWLNLELAKKPLASLEYILVHELVRLHERSHGGRFTVLMGPFMLAWRMHREVLHRAPLGAEDWGYRGWQRPGRKPNLADLVHVS